jgi:hypothetical protein
VLTAVVDVHGDPRIAEHAVVRVAEVAGVLEHMARQVRDLDLTHRWME